MRRQLLALALAAMLVLAGCSGDGGTETPTPEQPGESTPTASPTPTTAPSDDAAYPTGAGPDGFENLSAVVEQQGELLNGTAHTVVFDGERQGDQEGPVQLNVDSDGEQKAISLRAEFQSSEFDIWVDSDAVSVRTINDDQEQFLYFGPEAGQFADVYRNYDSLVVSSLVRQYVGAFQYEAVDSYEEGGTTYFVYETTGLNESFESNGNQYQDGDLTLTLREDGLVTEIEGSVSAQSGDQQYEESFTYTVETGSASPSKPAWVDEEIPQVSAELVDDKTVALTHEGGPELSGAQAAIQFGFEGASGSVDLSPGETVYLTASEGESGYELTVSQERPEPGSEALDLTEQGQLSVSIQGETVSVTLSVYQEETEPNS
jgi:hypothetical protein